MREYLGNKKFTWGDVITMNTGDMEKYCPKPHPVYFNAFSMWQQLSGSVQYLITIHYYSHLLMKEYLVDIIRGSKLIQLCKGLTYMVKGQVPN